MPLLYFVPRPLLIVIMLVLLSLVLLSPHLVEGTSQPKDSEVTKYPILIPKEEVTTEPSLVRSYEEELQDHQPGGNRPVRGRIDSADLFIKKCGDVREKCTIDGYKTTTEVGMTESFDDNLTTTIKTPVTMRSIGRPPNINFLRQPFYCRCDGGVCDEYGDCCWTIAKTLLYQNPWRCNRVQDENVWALMISKCSDASSPHRQSCEGPENIPHKQRSHLHDLPVYAKYSSGNGQLFRNIYCAKCNGVSSSEISELPMRLRCSQNFTQNELKLFMKSAVYKPGSRRWSEVGGDRMCSIYIPKLEHRKMDLKWEFPEIRYCRRDTVEECPQWYADTNPLDAALCSSYTQVVYDREEIIYKNPHCAKCNGLKNVKENLMCQHDREMPITHHHDPPGPTRIDVKLSPQQAGANLSTAGLSLLFDFHFEYVGYDSKCSGEMMWDYIRKKCTHTKCGKGYHLDSYEVACVPDEDSSATTLPSVDIPTKTTSRILLNRPKVPRIKPHPPQSSCYVIILHEGDFTMLENLSIIVNQTTEEGNKFKSLMLHPGEYSRWNETSVSICAKELHKGFTSRFSPILNYISITALSISVLFSSLHILLFVMIPKMQNLPGKNLFCLTLSLLVSQSIFLVFIGNRAEGVCVSAAIVMHYFFLASFFWMNIMSFDVWRTFSGEFMQRRPGGSVGTTFIKYSLYAWILPGIIVTCAAILDLWAADSFQRREPSDILRKLRPLYGHNNVCWITQGLPLLVFFVLPVIILISINIILFLITTKAILDQSNDSQRVFKGNDSEKGSRKDGDDVDRMKLYVKLGIIMGITWIIGFLSEVSGCEWLWYPFVIVNGLQGTFVFFAFDWKRTVWEMLKERVICFARFSKETREYGIARRDTTISSSTLTTSVGPTLKSFHGRQST